jgi:hypothetical protein
MVRKNEKLGVHSGNTLKGSNSRYNRRYAGQSGIVRHVDGGDVAISTPVCDVLAELNMDSSGVFYSLNKKGRWALPGTCYCC